MSHITIELVKNVIKEQFTDKKFTTGDLYYAIEPNFNKSKFGTIRNLLVKLSKEGFISYKMTFRGIPHFNSKEKRYGAVYTLNK